MKKYLVPVDGSKSSWKALAHAIARARAFQAAIDIVHVLPPSFSAELRIYEERDDLTAVLDESSRRVLASAVEEVRAAGVQQAGHLLKGDVGETIATFADRQKVDEIIMGSRGMGMLGAMVLGSVSSRVLHLAKVPVTFVK